MECLGGKPRREVGVRWKREAKNIEGFFIKLKI
jgi:hypothetical protein